MPKIPSENQINREVGSLIKQRQADKMIADLKKSFPKAEIFLVGGVMRDILMKREKLGDLDFVIKGITAANLKKFLSRQGKVNLVGKNFGVFKFRPKNSKRNEFIDIALPRTEHALGSGAYRDFAVQSNPELKIEEDLARRDFTINAMAWNIGEEKLIDPFGGANDIRGKIIRTVGEPKERFGEDYSRMLRAIRFAVELDFTIESRTRNAIKKMMRNINRKSAGGYIVPRETIAKEFLKCFAANAHEAFLRWDASHAFDMLIPEISSLRKTPQPKKFHAEGNAWRHLEMSLNVLNSKEYKKEFNLDEPPLYVSLGVLFHDIAKPKTIKPKSPKRQHISFPGHAEVGGKMTKAIAKRLKLESYKTGSIDIEAGKLGWLVSNHMFILGNDPKEVSLAKIEKYFMQDGFPGDYLLQISYCDIRGSKTSVRIANLYQIHYFGYKEKIRQLKKRFPKGLPKPLLDGDEIMAALKIKPGPKVAGLMEMLRNAQLKGEIKTKAQAKKYLKENAS